MHARTFARSLAGARVQQPSELNQNSFRVQVRGQAAQGVAIILDTMHI